ALPVKFLHRLLQFGCDVPHRSFNLALDALHLFVQAGPELFHRSSELASEGFEWMFRHDSPRSLYCLHNTADPQRREGHAGGRRTERLRAPARSWFASCKEAPMKRRLSLRIAPLAALVALAGCGASNGPANQAQGGAAVENATLTKLNL